MTRHPRPRPWILLPGLVAAGSLVACGGGSGQQAAKPANTVIQNKGSDTMVNLAQAWAEEYRKVAPDVEVEVSGGGSGVGHRGADQGHRRHRQLQPRHQAAGGRAGDRRTPARSRRTSRSATTRSRSTSTRTTRSTRSRSSSSREIYAEDGKITTWSELGVTIPGVRGRHDRPRQPPVELGHLRVLPRARARQARTSGSGSRDMNGSKEVVELVGSTPDRHRLQRHGLRDAGGQDAEGRRRPRASRRSSPTRGEHVHDKTLSDRALAAPLHARRAAGRGEGVHRLDPLRRGPEDRRGQRLRAGAARRAPEALTRRPERPRSSDTQGPIGA